MATEITELIQIPPNKKVIIDFYATWCGPCARVTPIIDELAEKFENIVFLKVNVDEADEIAAGFEISSLPTFVYLNLGNIVNRIEGANLQEVLRSIERLDQLVNKEEPMQKQEPRVEKKRIETRSEIEERTERKPTEKKQKEKEKKLDIKIDKDSVEKRKSREIEKKKSKKRSSKESQLKAERRNFENKNPYEIEYNNDTPKISTDDSDDISLESSS